MITQKVFPDFQIHNVPMEEFVYSDNKKFTYLLLDDINEKRWKLIIENMIATKITAMGLSHNFNIGGDFDKYYYIDNNGVRRFYNSVIVVEDSDWIRKLRLNAKFDVNGLGEAKHFIVPCYDYELEFIACGIKLEEQ